MSEPRALRLRAPAKINWTLEVLGKRPDGYHEVRTILQTIDLCDVVVLRVAEELSLLVRGKAAGRAIRQRWRASPETNLAFRAAQLLKERTGCQAGVEISLAKQIPVAAGLGGGSSDAAAVLRGLRRLWQLSISHDEMASVAAELGSDVPFFLCCGTALTSGRGELIEPLPDAPKQSLVVGEPTKSARPDKTARMYAALRPEHYADGSRSKRLAERLRAGEPVCEEDVYNAFEETLPEVDPNTALVVSRAREVGLGPAHLCGSGPAIFLLDGRDDKASFLATVGGYRFASYNRTLPATEARAVEEL